MGKQAKEAASNKTELTIFARKFRVRLILWDAKEKRREKKQRKKKRRKSYTIETIGRAYFYHDTPPRKKDNRTSGL